MSSAGHEGFEELLFLGKRKKTVSFFDEEEKGRGGRGEGTCAHRGGGISTGSNSMIFFQKGGASSAVPGSEGEGEGREGGKKCRCRCLKKIAGTVRGDTFTLFNRSRGNRRLIYRGTGKKKEERGRRSRLSAREKTLGSTRRRKGDDLPFRPARKGEEGKLAVFRLKRAPAALACAEKRCLAPDRETGNEEGREPPAGLLGRGERLPPQKASTVCAGEKHDPLLSRSWKREEGEERDVSAGGRRGGPAFPGFNLFYSTCGRENSG